MTWIVNQFMFAALLIITQNEAAKILLAPMPFLSHINEHEIIGEALIENGHEVKIMLSASYPLISKYNEETSRIKSLEYAVKYDDMYTMAEVDRPMSPEKLINVPPVDILRTNVAGFAEFCYNSLEDQVFYEKLRHEKFDLVIVDAFVMTRCYYILFYRLGIPYVSHTTVYEPWLSRSPALPSFVPFSLSTPMKSQNMTFMERIHNLYQLIDWTAYPAIPYLRDSLVSKYAPEMPFVTLDWLAGQSLLWLIDTDVAVDYPRPMMANEINVGGLSAKPAKPLTGEVLQLVNEAKDGIIVASFGSYDILTEDILLRFLETFSKLPPTVQIFMRYSKEVPSTIEVPKHVKLLKWLPQNDLLGLNKTRLFLTHGGANGQFEAVYHAVPMIVFPLFGDQPYNAKRAEYKGFALTMDILNFTPAELVSNIDRLLSTDTYQANVEKASRIFRSRDMNPRQRAVYWIEHVLEFGGRHLRSHALDMPWYQYLMLDIAALILVVVSVVVTIVFLWVKFVCMMFCQTKMKVKKD